MYRYKRAVRGVQFFTSFQAVVRERTFIFPYRDRIILLCQ